MPLLIVFGGEDGVGVKMAVGKNVNSIEFQQTMTHFTVISFPFFAAYGQISISNRNNLFFELVLVTLSAFLNKRP